MKIKIGNDCTKCSNARLFVFKLQLKVILILTKFATNNKRTPQRFSVNCLANFIVPWIHCRVKDIFLRRLLRIQYLFPKRSRGISFVVSPDISLGTSFRRFLPVLVLRVLLNLPLTFFFFCRGFF